MPAKYISVVEHYKPGKSDLAIWDHEWIFQITETLAQTWRGKTGKSSLPDSLLTTHGVMQFQMPQLPSYVCVVHDSYQIRCSISVHGNMNSVDWNGRMEWWSGLLEWSTGLDYWRGVAPLYACAMLLSVSVENLVGPRRCAVASVWIRDDLRLS